MEKLVPKTEGPQITPLLQAQHVFKGTLKPLKIEVCNRNTDRP
jgi:hypothetical protein